MRIYLIGMPGVGKTTIGKKVALELGYTFLDLDTYIEKEACMFIDEIFDHYGEAYFRALERNALKEASTQDNIIISCGGGIIKDKKNKEWMTGPCIYLSASLKTLSQRLEESSIVRPILLKKSLGELYMERKDLYAYFKDYEVLNENIEAATQNILNIVKEAK